MKIFKTVDYCVDGVIYKIGSHVTVEFVDDRDKPITRSVNGIITMFGSGYMIVRESNRNWTVAVPLNMILDIELII